MIFNELPTPMKRAGLETVSQMVDGIVKGDFANISDSDALMASSLISYRIDDLTREIFTDNSQAISDCENALELLKKVINPTQAPNGVKSEVAGDAVSVVTIDSLNQSVTKSEFEAVDVDYLPEIENLIAKVNRKAGKVLDLGGEFVTLSVTNRRKIDGEMLGACSVVADVSLVFGEASKLVLNGWQLVGTVDKGDDGINFVHTFGNDEDIDWAEYTHHHEPTCDACKFKRRRMKSHIIRNGRDVLEVGSECLKMYTGGYDVPALVRSMMKVNNRLAGYAMLGPKYERIDTEFFLALSFEAMTRYGWSSRSKPDGEPTADRALDAIRNNGGLLRSNDKFISDHEVSETSGKRAASALAWLSEVDTGGNTYLHNIKKLGSKPTFEAKYAGYVASIAMAYEKSRTRKQQAEKEQVESGYIGEPKKRLVFKDLELIGCFDIPGYYGTTYLHKFRDESCNIITWFSSSQNYGYDLDTNEIERSKARFTGKATVKKHEEYNGVKQTVITRAKFKVYVDRKPLNT